MTTDLFDNFRNNFQDFAYVDAQWASYYRAILDRRASKFATSWHHHASPPVSSSVRPRGESGPLRLARHLYYASSGQVRTMGEILRLSGLPVTEASIRLAAEQYYTDHLFGHIGSHIGSLVVEREHEQCAALLRTFYRRLLLGFVEGTLCVNGYFGSAFAVRRGRNEDILSPLVNAGFLMKRAEIGDLTSRDGSAQANHRFTIYSFHFGLVSLRHDLKLSWDEGGFDVLQEDDHRKRAASWSALLADCGKCDDAVWAIASDHGNRNIDQTLVEFFAQHNWLGSDQPGSSLANEVPDEFTLVPRR